MSVEFDPKKDVANIRKHGVSLAEGDGVLNDPLARPSRTTLPMANSGLSLWA